MLRSTKIILIVFVCLWGAASSVSNLTKWGDTMGNVAMVTSMSTVDKGAESFKATSNSVVILLGALFIVGSKLLSSALCGVGAFRMWGARSEDTATFAKSKELALAGCAVAIIMLFGGFIVIADVWFELWRSSTLGPPVLSTALRYATMILLIGIFVATKDE